MYRQQLKSVVRTSVLLIAASTFGLTGCVMLDVLAAAGGYQPPPPNAAYPATTTGAYSLYSLGTYVPSTPLYRPTTTTSGSGTTGCCSAH
jgi:hypothetical protein